MFSVYKTRLGFTWHAAVHLIGVGVLLVQEHVLHVHLCGHPLLHVCLKPLHLVRIRLLLLLLLLLLLVVVVLLL